jgi:hypothetical protein
MRRLARRGARLAALGVLAAAVPASAQLRTPEHWRWITDAPARLVTEQEASDSAWSFVAMPPGWHVTTGPGALLFDPATRADGRFRIEAETFLFPGESNAEYGIFLADGEIDEPGDAFVLFVIRRDGSAAVIRSAGESREILVPWTRHDSVRVPEGDGTAENALRVDFEPDRITFLVNGAELTTLPRDAAPLAGHCGLRIGPGVNIHVTNLDLTRRLAPAREG